MNLEGMKRVTLAAAAAESIDEVLRLITEGIAECRNVVLARIWLVDRSAGPAVPAVLKLAASAGNLRTPGDDPRRLDGRFSRFAMGERKVGRIALSGQGMLLEGLGDPNRAEWVARPEWALREGVATFAGHPLVARGETLGVLGVFDRKPISPEDFLWLRSFADHAALALSNRRAFEEIDRLRRRLEAENETLREEVAEVRAAGDIAGRSAALAKVLRQIDVVAPTDAAVLVLGESGVGKELVARAIHDRSLRRDRPFVRVNCGAIPGELFESEFFGHAKGAFTGAIRDRVGRFELADGGTILLDEVGEIPLSQQPKLLRVLQEGTFERVGEERTRKVDVRVVAATNRDLRRAAAEGRFRSDLYYRLSVFPVEVPPLRERREDLPDLVALFVRRAAERLRVPVPRVPASSLARLREYDWPGNVRELQHVVERAVLLARGAPLTFLDLTPVGVRGGGTASEGDDRGGAASGARPGQAPYAEAAVLPPLSTLRDAERSLVAEALRRTGGRVAGDGGAAQLLGVPVTTLDSKIRAFGLRGHGRRAETRGDRP